MIPTDETARQMFFLEAFLTHQKPLLFIGPTGTGKSAITNNYILGMPREKYDCLTYGNCSLVDTTPKLISIYRSMKKNLEQVIANSPSLPTRSSIQLWIENIRASKCRQSSIFFCHVIQSGRLATEALNITWCKRGSSEIFKSSNVHLRGTEYLLGMKHTFGDILDWWT